VRSAETSSVDNETTSPESKAILQAASDACGRSRAPCVNPEDQ
jgi:hypothetical protein